MRRDGTVWKICSRRRRILFHRECDAHDGSIGSTGAAIARGPVGGAAAQSIQATRFMVRIGTGGSRICGVSLGKDGFLTVCMARMRRTRSIPSTTSPNTA